ncbi:hypothetical protein MAR_018757 [Mya arenaria]|uniref:Uncharacterized protein n=1 Tax=Mya arenaria TaxID=6604 RepID=A0ABY7EIE0_MYAAR|nr:hypothetical protein MAR_018757 [Mya arenaria]
MCNHPRSQELPSAVKKVTGVVRVCLVCEIGGGGQTARYMCNVQDCLASLWTWRDSLANKMLASGSRFRKPKVKFVQP